jgi:tetratricopeptide (TPR) repeat protein
VQYHKFVLEKLIIEFHNNWLGEEKVYVNGQLVSRKSSVFGTNHRFNLIENGNQVRYVLSSKLTDMMQVALDLRKNGVIVQENVIVRYGFKSRKPVNRAKKEGLAKLQDYELEEAIEALQKALDIDPHDPEIWFHMACAYSVMENVENGFECLKKAVEYKLEDTDSILSHEMLAYLRIQKPFDRFLASNFTEYKIEPDLSNQH